MMVYTTPDRAVSTSIKTLGNRCAP